MKQVAFDGQWRFCINKRANVRSETKMGKKSHGKVVDLSKMTHGNEKFSGKNYN